jgi:hypothetical protein
MTDPLAIIGSHTRAWGQLSATEQADLEPDVDFIYHTMRSSLDDYLDRNDYGPEGIHGLLAVEAILRLLTAVGETVAQARTEEPQA